MHHDRTRHASAVDADARRAIALRFVVLLLFIEVLAALVPRPAHASEQPSRTASALAYTEATSNDPLALILDPLEWSHPYTIGTDLIEVWVCSDPGFGTSAPSPSTYAQRLSSEIAPWFAHHSRGRYLQEFVAGGTVECDGVERVPNVTTINPFANASFILNPWHYGVGGGIAGPGFGQPFANQNSRSGIVGTDSDEADSLYRPDTVHELGHMVFWPHSFTGQTSDQYDIVHDVMSDNNGSEEPYGTAVINYYAAGWIDLSEVAVVPPGGTSLTLVPVGSDQPGLRMAVIPDGYGKGWVFGARVGGLFDPIPAAWEGVEIVHVSNYEGAYRAPRRVAPYGDPVDDWDNYLEKPIEHVLPAGSSVRVGAVQVSVSTATHGYHIVFGPGAPLPSPPPPAPPPPFGFIDTFGHIFQEDIYWLAFQGITRGCNPPVNDRFCPEDFVTRGQMAAFLTRAFGLPPHNGPDRFRDDDQSIFESSIESLAQAGITVGCNPPANDRFCPDKLVTRGQMAAFLTRAFGLPPYNGPDRFRDDDQSIFESSIESLAQAGITLGCNPPANDRFCPDKFVTRGQMAAFLRRAFSNT